MKKLKVKGLVNFIILISCFSGLVASLVSNIILYFKGIVSGTLILILYMSLIGTFYEFNYFELYQ